ncbi:MAG: T9SS type A sorting domain-containing protein [Flavobacteriales bacterium]
MITSLNAQITFEFADLPVPGDVVERYVDTIPSFGPGVGGAMQVWDFTSAVPDETVITTVSTPATTPYAGSFTASNLAMTNDGINYLYFSTTPASFIATGAAGDFLEDGQQLVVPFNPTLTGHQFPRNYGDQFSDTYGFEVVADGAAFSVHSVRLRHRGNVRDTTDAYGQITTPVGTYDALRVKSTDVTTDSIWIRLFSFAPWTFAQALSGTAVSYSWLAKETKLAVAEMTFDSLGVPARFTYSSIPPSISTGLVALGANTAGIHPVPARDGFTLSLEGSGSHDRVEVFTADGRSILVAPLTHLSSHWFDTSDWGSGIYLLRLWPVKGGEPLVLRAVVQ